MTADRPKLLPVVTIRVGGRRRKASPQGSLFAVDGSSSPPATRGECPSGDHQCPHAACTMNLDADTERAGRPHRGVHPLPTVRRRYAVTEAVTPRTNCALDHADSGDEVASEKIAKLIGVSSRRVQQLTDRGLDKQWVALQLIETVEDWAEARLYPHGATLDHLWGVIVDEDGQQVARANDVDTVFVTIAVNIKRLRRPAPVPAAVRAAGVEIRRKGR